MNWYIVQAYSGFEKKGVESINDELKKHKLSENLQEILVPTHQVTEVKKGKRTKKEKKFFPGYVLVKVELTKQIYHLIKNLQKVSGFLGSSDKPTPISDNEIKRILGQVSESEKREWLNSATCLVAPSITLSSSRTESMPVAIMEALSNGLPIIATRVGGIPEIINDTNGI